MGNIIIRKADKQDVGSLNEICKEFISYHRNLRDSYKSWPALQERIGEFINDALQNRNEIIFIAEINGKLIGALIGSIEEGTLMTLPEEIGKISLLFVKERYRHKKIGAILLDNFSNWALKHRISHIELFVDAKNQLGISAWEKYGFSGHSLKMRKKID